MEEYFHQIVTKLSLRGECKFSERQYKVLY